MFGLRNGKNAWKSLRRDCPTDASMKSRPFWSVIYIFLHDCAR